MYRNNRWKCDIARISYCSYINLPSVTSLISGVIAVHSNADFHENNGIIHDVMENIRISSPAEDFNIYFNYDPQSAYTDQNGVRHNEPNFTKIPPVKTLMDLLHISLFYYHSVYIYMPVQSMSEMVTTYYIQSYKS